MDAGAAIAIGLGSALLGALAAGLIQVLLALWERSTRSRVAARVVLGDIYVAEKAFELVIERKEWWTRSPDFDRAAATWAEHRADFAAVVSTADWADVDAFYNNLGRSAALWRPGEPATPADLRVAREQVEYAKAAQVVAARHVTKRFRGNQERSEVIGRLGQQQAGDLLDDGESA